MSDAKTESAPPKKSKKLLVIAVLGLALAGGGGAGAWFFLGKKAHGDDEEARVEKKHEAKPLFTTLEPFTVNLQDPRGERFAQIGVTLQFEDPSVDVKIKDRLPAVRNEILLLISSKQIDELLSTEGKQKLAQEIRLRTGRSLGYDLPDPEPAPAVAAASDTKVAKVTEAKEASEHKDAADDDEVEAKPKPKKKKKKAREVVENPIQQVLFAQFIVQ
jgi:flagellar FliL protein